MGGWMDELTSGWMGRRTDGVIDAWMVGWMDGMDGLTDERTEGRMDRRDGVGLDGIR